MSELFSVNLDVLMPPRQVWDISRGKNRDQNRIRSGQDLDRDAFFSRPSGYSKIGMNLVKVGSGPGRWDLKRDESRQVRKNWDNPFCRDFQD